MKKSLAFIAIAFLTIQSFAQCVIEPYSLEKRVRLSDLVVEAQVVDRASQWDKTHSMIYTVNTLKVYKIFDGNVSSSQNVKLITVGGRVGLDMLKAEPSLQVEASEFGVFLMKEDEAMAKKLGLEGTVYLPSASVQSFIKYDIHTNEAFSYYKKYDGRPILHEELTNYTEKTPVVIEKAPWENDNIKPISAPFITSWSKDTVAAGTQILLTINGGNFYIARGSGKVEFRDANYGDGRFYKPQWGTSYKSWSNSKIEVYVPSRAGTGKVRITNNTNESVTTTSDLFVAYSHLNVSFGNTTVDTAYWPIDHVNDNSNGGYTWQMNRKFRLHDDAVNSFMRALETWRCGTLVNWDVGDDTNIDDIEREGVNVVRHTKFGDSKLGVCYSWYKGCYQGTNLHWYADELDIEFDSTYNWYYGTGNPGSSKYDFESVAVHELGHGHQLGHVIDDEKIMHYSLGRGDRSVELDNYDVAGGIYVREKSKVNNGCGPGRHEPIQQIACNITKPKALFALSVVDVCPSVNITATDQSEGIVKQYSWDLGDNASPAAASTKGPHTFSYSTSGEKTVRLIVTNDFGSDTASKIVQVAPPPPIAPQAFAFDDSVCTGKFSYMISSVPDATEYLWEVPTGGNIDGSFKDTMVTVYWVLEGGPYGLYVRAVNSCGSSDSVSGEIHVTKSAVADFTSNIDGRQVDFTFTGESADEYAWDFGDGNTSTEADPTNLYPTAATYTAQLIVSNHCSSDTASEELETTFGTGISQSVFNPFVIYPNPASHVLNLETDLASGSISIFDVEGRKVVSTSVSEMRRSGLNVSELANGMYILQLSSGGNIYKAEFLKK